jgi:hypothetical protein
MSILIRRQQEPAQKRQQETRGKDQAPSGQKSNFAAERYPGQRSFDCPYALIESRRGADSFQECTFSMVRFSKLSLCGQVLDIITVLTPPGLTHSKTYDAPKIAWLACGCNQHLPGHSYFSQSSGYRGRMDTSFTTLVAKLDP